MSVLVSATEILRVFSADTPEVTVTDLVRQLGMPKSNASRLLRAMRDAGLLETVGESKRFRPSLMLVNVGRNYAASSSLISRADAVVQKISRATGHTGYVSKRDGVHIVAVTDHPGTNALRVVSNIGRLLPAFATATGRSLLARRDDAFVGRLYPEGLPEAPSTRAPQTMADLYARLADVRKTGIATSFDEASRGVAAVAVAVGDGTTDEEVSLCIVYPVTITDTNEQQAITRALQEGVAEIAALQNDPVVTAGKAGGHLRKTA